MTQAERRQAFAPGRVNLIGDHTDYAAGKALPIALRLGTTATFHPNASGDLVVRSSDAERPELLIGAGSHAPGSTGAMIEGLVRSLGPVSGLLELRTTLPLGAGLSSSASMLVAAALALGVEGGTLEVAELCQGAEAYAGQAVGLMDQLAILEGRDHCALLLDFASAPTWVSTPVDHSASFLIVHSGVRRSLATGGYGERRAECDAASQIIGPLGLASIEDVAAISNPMHVRRATHVITETERVDVFARRLRSGSLKEAGALMVESHRSLSELFEVSTPAVDALVEHLVSLPGVFGARMTGGGFGGCVVALMEHGAVEPSQFAQAWAVEPSQGASLEP